MPLDSVNEIWRAVPGFEGAYQVSNLGRVKSLDRSWQQRTAKGTFYTHNKRGVILKPGPSKCNSGHLSVVLGRGCGSRTVHELVLLAFVGPRPAGYDARHMDGDVNNNRLANLQWSTRSRNIQDIKWHKLPKARKLTGEQARELKALLGTCPNVELAMRFNIAQSTVSAIKYGKFHNDV